MLDRHDLLPTRVSWSSRLVVIAAGILSLGTAPMRTTPPVLLLRPAPVVGGHPVAGSVTLSSPAPTGGTSVTITTSSIDAAPLQNNVPGGSSAVASVNVVVPAGQTVAGFRINTVGVTTVATVTISAVVAGETG